MNLPLDDYKSHMVLTMSCKNTDSANTGKG